MKNDCLNVWKGLAAFFVIFIHVSFPSPVGGMMNGLARFGVPLFFMVAGYFCFGRGMDTLKRRGKKILSLFLWGNGIYFLWKLLLSGMEGLSPVQTLRRLFTAERVGRWLLWNESPMEAHLWFLGALLYCYLFYGLLVRTRKEEKAYFLIPLCLGTNLLLGVVLPMLGMDTDAVYIRNFWLTGLPFFLLGHWLAGRQEISAPEKAGSRNTEHRNTAHRSVLHRNAYCMAAVALGAVLSMAEMLLSGGAELYVGSLLMVGGLFIFALWNPGFGKNSILARIGERDALHMYLWQMLVFDLLRMSANTLGVREHVLYGWLIPLLVCLGSWLLAEGIYFTRQQKEKK